MTLKEEEKKHHRQGVVKKSMWRWIPGVWTSQAAPQFELGLALTHHISPDVEVSHYTGYKQLITTHTASHFFDVLIWY